MADPRPPHVSDGPATTHVCCTKKREPRAVIDSYQTRTWWGSFSVRWLTPFLDTVSERGKQSQPLTQKDLPSLHCTADDPVPLAWRFNDRVEDLLAAEEKKILAEEDTTGQQGQHDPESSTPENDQRHLHAYQQAHSKSVVANALLASEWPTVLLVGLVGSLYYLGTVYNMQVLNERLGRSDAELDAAVDGTNTDWANWMSFDTKVGFVTFLVVQTILWRLLGELLQHWRNYVAGKARLRVVGNLTGLMMIQGSKKAAGHRRSVGAGGNNLYNLDAGDEAAPQAADDETSTSLTQAVFQARYFGEQYAFWLKSDIITCLIKIAASSYIFVHLSTSSSSSDENDGDSSSSGSALLWKSMLVVFVGTFLNSCVCVVTPYVGHFLAARGLTHMNARLNACDEAGKNVRNLRIFRNWMNPYVQNQILPKRDAEVSAFGAERYLIAFNNIFEFGFSDLLFAMLLIWCGAPILQAQQLKKNCEDFVEAAANLTNVFFHWMGMKRGYRGVASYVEELGGIALKRIAKRPGTSNEEREHEEDAKERLYHDNDEQVGAAPAADNTADILLLRNGSAWTHTRPKLSLHAGGELVPLSSVLRAETDVLVGTNEIVLIQSKPGDGKTMSLLAMLGELYNLDGCGNSRCFTTTGTGAVTLHTAYAPQVPFLKNGSIRANVLFGLPMVDGLYKLALELADFSEVLDDGAVAVFAFQDETILVGNGENVSGGQKQRISLARCFYRALYATVVGAGDINGKNAPSTSRALVLLDDAFSALDPKTAAKITQGLTEFLRGTGLPISVVATMTSHAGYLPEMTNAEGVREEEAPDVPVSYRQYLTDAATQILRVQRGAEEDEILLRRCEDDHAATTKKKSSPGAATDDEEQQDQESRPSESHSSPLVVVHGSPLLQPEDADDASTTDGECSPSAVARTCDPLSTYGQCLVARYQAAAQEQREVLVRSTSNASPTSNKPESDDFALALDDMEAQTGTGAAGWPLYRKFFEYMTYWRCGLILFSILLAKMVAQLLPLVVAYYATLAEGRFDDSKFVYKWGLVEKPAGADTAGGDAAPQHEPQSLLDAQGQQRLHTLVVSLTLLQHLLFETIRYFVGTAAAITLARGLGHNVMRNIFLKKSLQSFWSRTPLGAVQNRLSIDLGDALFVFSSTDGGTPLMLFLPLASFFWMFLFQLLDQSVANPWWLILVLNGGVAVIGVFCWSFWMSHYRAGLREAIRLQARANTALNQSFQDLTSGGVVFRAFAVRSISIPSRTAVGGRGASANESDVNDLALAESLNTLSTVISAHLVMTALDLWSGLRLELVRGLVGCLAPVFKLVGVCSSSGDAASYRTYALAVDEILDELRFLLRSIPEIEKGMILLERLTEWDGVDEEELRNQQAAQAAKNSRQETEQDGAAFDVDGDDEEEAAADESRTRGSSARIAAVEDPLLLSPKELVENSMKVAAAAGENLCLRVDNLSLEYHPGAYALKNVNFDVQHGERVVLVGRSGSGKTSLLNSLLQIVQPSHGSIVYKRRRDEPTPTPAASNSNDDMLLINHGDRDANPAEKELPSPIDVNELRTKILVAFPQSPLVLRGSFFYNCDITGELDKRTKIFPVLLDLFGDWARERIASHHRDLVHHTTTSTSSERNGNLRNAGSGTTRNASVRLMSMTLSEAEDMITGSYPATTPAPPAVNKRPQANSTLRPSPSPLALRASRRRRSSSSATSENMNLQLNCSSHYGGMNGANNGSYHDYEQQADQITTDQVFGFFDGTLLPEYADISSVLSQSQKQLLHMARMLSQEEIPDVVLLDEISAALPDAEANEMFETLLNYLGPDKTVICITHQTHLACFRELFDRRIELALGKVVEDEKIR
eukprot:g9061.t1